MKDVGGWGAVSFETLHFLMLLTLTLLLFEKPIMKLSKKKVAGDILLKNEKTLVQTSLKHLNGF